MNVLVDTSIWSLALRRKAKDLSLEEKQSVFELMEMVKEDRVVLIGPIRQEILTGIRDTNTFDRLRTHLSHFSDYPLTTADFEEAAHFDNRCRTAGIRGSAVDFLICAVASRNDFSIFTMDSDFENYARQLDLILHHPRTKE